MCRLVIFVPFTVADHCFSSNGRLCIGLRIGVCGSVVLAKKRAGQGEAATIEWLPESETVFACSAPLWFGQARQRAATIDTV